VPGAGGGAQKIYNNKYKVKQVGRLVNMSENLKLHQYGNKYKLKHNRQDQNSNKKAHRGSSIEKMREDT